MYKKSGYKFLLFFKSHTYASSFHGVSTVVLAPHDPHVHPRQVLGPASLHQNHVVLLQGVALPGDERYKLLPVAQPHAAALAVGRVRLLGFPDDGLEYDSLHLRSAAHGAGRLRPLLDRTIPDDLVYRPTARWGDVEPSDASC